MKKRLRNVRQTKTDDIPEYTLTPEKKERKKIPRWLRNSVIIVIAVTTILYLPPAILHSDSESTTRELEADVSAVLSANRYLKDHPNDDFDWDGLVNSKEEQIGSDPYRVDTDGDGLMDASEVFLTETNPAIYNKTMLEIAEQQMVQAGKKIQTPFKINNVVLWPDDMESRAYGAVVRTLNGYRLCNFKGWAQFPEGEYVYKIEKGIHVELKRNEDGAVYIPGPETTVEVYAQPLEMLYQLSFCEMPVYLNNSLIGNILCFLLPEDGPSLLSCKRLASVDLDPDVRAGAEAPIDEQKPVLDDSRFGRNQILLEDLARVRESIESGEAVFTSLFSPVRGEAIVLIYGYTAEGDLLATDWQTGEHLGELQIEERASRLYDSNGNIIQYEWFTFDGLGFSSLNKDRISFFETVLSEAH